jgi:hypothetical protein
MVTSNLIDVNTFSLQHFKKKMKNLRALFPIVTAGIILIVGSCKKDDFENEVTLHKLYKSYKNGKISECYFDGELVYSAGLNAYDAGETIYNEEGKQIGTCNYAWGQTDEICGELEDCEIIYCVKDNIWGQPKVDKYGLGN